MRFVQYQLCLILMGLALIGAKAQPVLRGQVTEAESGHPVAAATVVYMGTSTGVVADTMGRFRLPMLPDSTRIQISHTGFLPFEIHLDTIDSNAFLSIGLYPTTILQGTPVLVAATRIPVTLNVPAPVMKLYSTDLQREDNLSIAPALNRIPGVFMQSGTLSTNRISIRGVGSRSLFTTAKIRAYLDEIPLTNGVGETALEDIDLSLLSEVEIFKGPTASEYGAGLGGLIHLKSMNYASDEASSISAQVQTGAFGTQRYLTTLHLRGERARLDLNYNRTHSEGWRDNSAYEREGLTALSKVNTVNNGITTLLANYTYVKGFIPSSLNQAAFNDNPRQAAAIWGNISGFKEYHKILAGLSHQQKIGINWEHTTSLFGTWRDGYEPRPFGILDEKNRALGGRTRLDYKPQHSGQYSIGAEVFSEQYDWQNFQLQRRTDGTVAPDTLLQNNKERRFYYNLFASAEWRREAWTLHAGVNVNQTYYTLTDLFLRDGNDLSGSYDFNIMFSPRIGLVYRPSSEVNIYATVSHGFSPPTLEETLTPAGAINPDIRPEQGWNFEIGSRGANIWQSISYEITFYTMRIRDLLVARRTAIDQFIGVNAGQTTHHGIEAYVHYKIMPALHVFAAYTFADYTFTSFIDGDNDFSGNRLTGTAPHIASTGLDFNDLKTKLYANITFQYTDAIPVNDANSIYASAYRLYNIKVGRRTSLYKKWHIDVYAGVNNLLNEKYASMLQINALGAMPRYFYPGLPRHAYGGISLRYTWDRKD
ncbi:MAG TPA: TonB-dependent receptor [Saprospiraceae bacterium]|nr:TonB-dependent receptor [Saprospiraceae bacterium]HMP24777.1 TonB-dependent receptor [Saprospiraceae bacterium]